MRDIMAAESLPAIVVSKPFNSEGTAPHVHPRELFPTSHFPNTSRFKRGEVMYHAGDPAATLYLVQEGIAKELTLAETGENYITALATPNTPVILGLETLDGKGVYGNSAKAVTEVTAQRIPLRDVGTLTRNNSEYSLAIARHVIRTIRSKRFKYADMVFLDLQARLAVELMEKAGQLTDYAENSEGLPEFSKLTQEDLADMIGATRERVNQLLGYWEDKEYLQRVGRRIIIRNPYAMECIGANSAVLNSSSTNEVANSAGVQKDGQRKTA